MADQKKNDVAEALAALAGGGVPSEGETPSGGMPSESTVFSPPPLSPSPSSTPAVPPPTLLSSTPLQPAMPFTLPSPPVTSADERPRPIRAGTPTNMLPKELLMPSAVPPPARIRPASPDGSPARARPAMPERSVVAPPPKPVPVDDVPEVMPELIEDEETIAAAPDISAFARKIVVPKPARAPVSTNLAFRRTIIPILLTCGVMLPAIGLWTMLDHNAPLAAVGSGVEWMLIVVGAILLLLGIINALHVRHVLEMSATVLGD